MILNREAKVSIWGASGTTLGAVSFVAICATGSAAVGAVNILDDTDLKYVIPLAVTGSAQFAPAYAVAFQNLIVSVVSTAGYSITYLPRP